MSFSIPDALDQQFGFHLRLAQLNVFSDLIDKLKDLDLRPVDIAALRLIEANAGIRQHIIGDHLNIARPNVVKLIDTLQERGLTERLVDEKDRRANQITLTPKGIEILSEADRIEAEHRARLVGLLQKAGVDPDSFMTGLRVLGSFR
ncbi:MAG: MarR family transcriptional regulator [Asticcacaulis sp.]